MGLIIKDIDIKIKNGLEEYKERENKIIDSMDMKNAKYSTHNERPVAAFLTTWLARDNLTEFHELPLKGIGDEEVEKILLDFISKAKIKKKVINKKYKSYNVDGYIMDGDTEIENDFFIEYKVNNKKIKISDLAMDFLKFLIYTNASDKTENFVYVVLYKGKSSFNEIKPGIQEIKIDDFEKLTKSKCNVFTYAKSAKISYDKESMINTFSGMQLINDFSNDGKTKITKNKFDKYENNEKLNLITHFGTNVFFSHKMNKNYWIFKELRDAIKDQNNYTNLNIGTIEKNFIIDILKKLKMVDKDESNVMRKTLKQATNWWLAFIVAGAEKHFKIDFIDKIVYNDVNKYGKIWSNYKMEDFRIMVRHAAVKIKDEEIVGSKVYGLLVLICQVYELTFDTDEMTDGLLKKNDDYRSYMETKRIQEPLKEIYFTIFNTKYGSDVIYDTEVFLEDASIKIINALKSTK